jgi:hypothetical protein
MMPIPPEDQPAPIVPNVCDRCGLPVVHAGGPAGGGGWVHAEAADAAFCQLIYGGT